MSSTVNYLNSTNPLTIAQNQRALYNQQYSQQTGGAPVNTVAGTANYLNSIESPLAAGDGGYNSSEASQIELTPEQKQAMITSAGISAGQGTASAVGAADRAAAAAGGSPAAMATYRARAAQTEGANAGNAETNAAVAAQEAGSAGAQTVGNARLAQQNQGLNYYQGQNAQANQNAQQANQLQQTAASSTVPASSVPTTFDKVVGGVAGALGALDEGTMPKAANAVVGENGLEWIGKPKNYLDSGTVPSSGDGTPGLVVTGGQSTFADGKMSKNYLDDGTTGDPDAITDIDPNQQYGTTTPGTHTVPFWKRLAANMHSQQAQKQGQSQPWNPTTPFSQLGSAAGSAAKTLVPYLDEGVMPASGNPLDRMAYTPDPPAMSVPPRSMLSQGAVVSKPTNVHLDPDDAVVPLSYRPQAKVRPSMALKNEGRKSYGATA